MSPDLVDPTSVAGPLVVLDRRRAVRVTGQDRRSFLDATLSQRLEDLEDGTVRRALWLDVHGAPLAAMDVAADPDGEALVLVVDRDALDAVLEGLAMRTFLADATFALVEDAVVVAVRGAPEVAVGPAAVVRDGDVLVVGDPEGVDLVGPRSGVDAWLEARGLPAAADRADALSDWEVRHGRPRFGHEVVGPHLPEETGTLPTHVHLAKGCYPGQEAVARMWMLGRPRRRLAVLDVAGAPAPGDEAGTGRDRVVVTRVTSTAPTAALAFVPSGAEVGDEVEAEGWTATVRAFVGDGLTPPGADPAVTRRRDRPRAG